MDSNCRYHFDHESRIKSNETDIKALESKVTELDKQFVKIDGYNKEAHDKIKKVADKADHIERMAFAIESMQENLGTLMTTVSSIGERLTKIENAPGQKAIAVVKYVVVAVGGYYLNQIMNGGL